MHGLTYLISDAERILPSNISLAAFATAFPGPMDATAKTLSPLEDKVKQNMSLRENSLCRDFLLGSWLKFTLFSSSIAILSDVIARIVSVSVGFESKERPTNGIFGVLPTRKVG